MGNGLRRMLGSAALGAILATTPVAVDLHGGFGLTAPKAFAKDGGRDGGGGSNSGKGSSGSGSSGSGGGDDHGGSSGGGDHGGSGGSGRGGGDDVGGDDRGGRGGTDDRQGDDHGGNRANGSDDAAGGTAARGTGLRVVTFERTADGVEVTYSNGLREEVSRGRFEQKDAAGRTLIERPATDADLKRIARNTKNSGIVPVPIRTEATKVEARGASIEVTYGTGWREELEGGRYELKDPNNNTVIERPATAGDVSRLRAMAGG